MKVGVITSSLRGLVPQRFSREPIPNRILSARPSSKTASVANMEIIISSEGRKLASQSTPVEKLSMGSSSALLK